MSEPKELIRAFVAVPVAEAVARELERLLSRLRPLAAGGPRLRWVTQAQLHITLRFLGEHSPQVIDQVKDALGSARLEPCFQPFDIELTRAGAFPDLARPRTLWLGGDRGAAELTVLARGVDDVLADVGIPREQRPFKPHLTLARCDGAALPKGMLEALKKIPPLRWRCNGFDLMRSRLTPQGAVYTKLAHVEAFGQEVGLSQPSA